MILKKDRNILAAAARGDWDRVRGVVGALMEPQYTYPECWRVREFPSTELHEKIGQML